MPLECGIIFDGIPEGAISRKVGLIWGIPGKVGHYYPLKENTRRFEIMKERAEKIARSK